MIRLLGRELKNLRIRAGFTQEQVAEELNCSVGRIVYTESGKGSRPNLEYIRALLDLYGVRDEAARETLIGLARRGRQKGWWTFYSDLFPAGLPGWEEDASVIRTYDNIIPGLLQTRDYATALFKGIGIHMPLDIERKTAGRMRRQEILRRENPPELWAVIDEAALRRLVGGREVMYAQLGHLLELASRPNITIQILPFDADAYEPIDGTFHILDFGELEQPSLVYIATAGGPAFLERPEEVERCTLVFDRAVMASKSPQESLRFITDLMEHLKE
ncbi:helix-turn-helix transcriptional regulator [Thermopolyspora sp. NPDC052614]|uniref:helix-turn-helix domain-containing protein n=1 Tax=Thermopolyspora sp. NPDC052614 TaxID=3155682 RepID=UPI003438618A